jgi:hypothetical protein
VNCVSAAIATLPSEIRGPVHDRVAELEAQLARGELKAPPPLD